MHDLTRFIEAQETMYPQAVAELREGYKTGHWMWYIFPQIIGLGYSDVSKYYAIKSMDEAKEYLKHKVLGSRLMEITTILLEQETDDINLIFSNPDNLKFHSSMTLFAKADEENRGNIFEKALSKYFKGKYDKNTIEILENEA